MDKKDIYEHLAKIYLDASSKKKKKTKKHSSRNTFFLIFGISILGLAIVLPLALNRKNLKNSEIALILQPEAVKLNFHFDPAKKESYSLNLNKLNLAAYGVLEFAVKKVDYQESISLRVEFTSIFKERSEIYLKDIPNKWQTYRINLSDFKNIGDWSEMQDLSFVVEEWNATKRKGIVYVDNVRVLRK